MADNALLPAAFGRVVGDMVYAGLRDGFEVRGLGTDGGVVQLVVTGCFAATAMCVCCYCYVRVLLSSAATASCQLRISAG
jgi:hypothetical protein